MLRLLCFTTALLFSSVDQIQCIEQIAIDGGFFSQSANFGTLRALNNGSLGFICNNEDWPLQGDNVAIVACNQLGYTGPNHKVVPVPNYFWLVDPPDRVWLHGLSCDGNEQSLGECQLGDWNSDDACFTVAGVLCDDNEDHLDVQLIDGPADNDGVLQVRYNGVWATICLLGSSNDYKFLSVICRQLGYNGESPQINQFAFDPSDDDKLIITDGIVCDGNETNLDQCRSSVEWDLDFSACGTPVEVECSLGLDCFIEDVRLAGGTSEGVVEVLYQGDCPGKWVNLCDVFNPFQNNAVADVVCGQIGYKGTNNRLIESIQTAEWTDNLIVECDGHESSLQQCTMRKPQIQFECNSVSRVACDDTVYPSCPGYQGWFVPHRLDTSCFRLFEMSVDSHWKEAERHCQLNNGSLATIRDQRDIELFSYIVQQEQQKGLTPGELAIRDAGVYIGLTLTDDGRTRRWVDGRPVSFTKWQYGNPDGGSLEACTKMVYDKQDSTWYMNDIPCVAPQTKYFMCTTMVQDLLEEIESIQPVEGPGCGTGMFTCLSGECIRNVYVCDGQEDCREGDDEVNCADGSKQSDVLPTVETFSCATGDKSISVSFVCDFIQHCPDNSDEIDCDYPQCEEDQFQCADNRCITVTKRCNSVDDCLNGEDELDCDYDKSPFTFQCYAGQFIPTEAVCDGQVDCLGLSSEDEPMDCADCDSSELQCNNGACYGSEYQCIYGYTEYGYPLGCRDATNLLNCSTFDCPVGTAKCNNSYCIQLQHVCDGMWDCPNGEDEHQCDAFKCPGHYRCHSVTVDKAICVTLDQLCDGQNDCPLADDELLCGLECPDSCLCNGLSYSCNGTSWSTAHASMIPIDVRQLDVTNQGLSTTRDTRDTSVTIGYIRDILFMDVAKFRLLIHLNLANNGIGALLPDEFINNGNLRTLILSDNNIQHLENGNLAGLDRLEYLDLRGNPLYTIHLGSFLGLTQIQFIDISDSEIDIRKSDLDNKHHLIPGGPPQSNGGPRDFQHLEKLYSDQYYFCCIVEDYTTGVDCLPEAGLFSSCEDLLRYGFLSGLTWVIGFSALLGNLFVILWRAYPRVGKNAKHHHTRARRDRSVVQSVLITNLAISDGMMGVYMLIIASADSYYRGTYAFNAESWQTSGLCKFAGFLSVLSSEASVLFIAIISIDRCFCIVLPLSQVSLKPTSARVAAVSAWMIAFVFSILPLLPIDYFKDELEFYGRSPVCLALPLTTFRPAGWEYSVALFLCLNLAAFVVVFICYSLIFHAVKKSREGRVINENRTEEIRLALRMGLLVFTDFCCWMPIIFIGFLALMGLDLSSAAYVWIAVFVLPLNSALNPYLYTIATREMKKFQDRKLGDQKSTKTPSFKTLDIVPFANQLVVILQANVRTRFRSYTLSSIMRGKLSFSPEDVDTIERDIRKALDYLHGSGIHHGGVTEENILIENNEGWRGFLMVSTERLTQKLQTTKLSSTISEPSQTNDANIDEIAFEMNAIYDKDNTQLTEMMNKIRARVNRSAKSLNGVSLISSTITDSFTGSTSLN